MSNDQAVPGETVYAGADDVRKFVSRLVEAHGAPADDARIVASCLVRADLRGVDTHGIARLPGYLDRVRRNLVNPRPDLQPKRVSPVASHLDGSNGFGFVVATRAMAEAMDIARTMGL